MNLLEIFVRWTGLSSDALIDVLSKSSDPRAAEIIAKLRAAGTPENLASIAPDILRETLNVITGKFEPRSHASDSA